MNKFIEITNNIIKEKLVDTDKIVLSKIEYGVEYQILYIKVVYYETNIIHKREFKYSFSSDGKSGFSDVNTEILRTEFSSYINDIFKNDVVTDWADPNVKKPYQGQRCIVKIETYKFSGTTSGEYEAVYKDGLWIVLSNIPSYSSSTPSIKIVGWKAKEGKI
jgi:hypothetical protein